MKISSKTVAGKSIASLLVAGLLAANLSVAVSGNAQAQDLPPLIRPGMSQPIISQPASDYNPNATNLYQAETVSLRGRVSTVPMGTMLMVRVDQPVSAAQNRLGEPVTGTLENDIFINDSIAIPAGSQVLGHVAAVEPPTHMGKHGTLDIRFDSIKLVDGTQVPMRAHIVTSDQTGVLKGDTYTKDVLKGVGIAAGATGVGTLMGLSAGSLIGSAGAGALFGLGVGALGGMTYAVVRKGKDVQIPSGSRLSITLDQPVTVNL
ncbi:MAG: hypothetical protein VKJ04_11900 [Vampirovibrionales bacterium]|nr:hypothetical protein [Vampirovibrionales bacterium]